MAYYLLFPTNVQVYSLDWKLCTVSELVILALQCFLSATYID